ncbi:MAG TPA: xanthine dehydrogenase family protein molybdopterin-binding subunit [Xanthobacteraceae bacterium]|nr:xanthine dehydrogenase family protein molybdopterin-binding subunit [Xanthobacteraceae bacterium]
MSAALHNADRPNSYIGRSVTRPNALRLLAGKGRYVTDIKLPRMLHAAFLRSPYAHANITSIDISEAKALKGVHLVATGEDLAKLCKPWVGTLDHFRGMKSAPQLPLAVGKVVWAGQAIVAVVAETRAIAEDALNLIQVEFEELEPVADIDLAREPDATRIYPELGDNVAFKLTVESGDVAAAFAKADGEIEATIISGRHTAVTMEPRAIVADYNAPEEALTVYHATQTPYQFQDLFSRLYGIRESRVRVIAPDIGGSFGMKLHVYHEDMSVVGLSMLCGRPVKYVADRLESFVSDIHARDHRVKASIAFDKEGTILGMKVDDVTAIGPFSTAPRTSVVEGNQVVRLIGAPYRFRDYRADLSVVFQNKVQTSQYRAVGHPVACLVTESMMDRVAQQLGMDPFEIRRRNIVTQDMYPYTSPAGYKFERLSHEACLEKLHKLMDYDRLRAEQKTLREKGIHRGIGIGMFVEITNPSPAFYGVGGARISSQDGAVLKVTPAGEVQCLISVGEHGQGTETIIGQIVAEHLGVERELVRVITGDTDVTPQGGANWACRGAGIGGETALQASKKLKANILSVAAAILQSKPELLDLRNGNIVDAAEGTERLPLSEVARISYYRSDTLPPGTSPQLTAAHHYSPQGYPFAFTNGVQACHVEVDVETGFTKILNVWVVEDCGRIINPMLVEEQVRGGVVQGLGAAFFEECRYSETGQLENGSLADYLVPMACEMPDIKIDHVETPTEDTELGAKGCGEAGTAAASAAALNAVNDAIAPFGASVSQVPMTPQRLLTALGHGSSSSQKR